MVGSPAGGPRRWPSTTSHDASLRTLPAIGVRSQSSGSEEARSFGTTPSFELLELSYRPLQDAGPPDEQQPPPAFSSLLASADHTFFSTCDQLTHRGRRIPRAVIVSGRCVYLCDEEGRVGRCIDVRKVAEVLVAGTTVALRVPTQYDAALGFTRSALAAAQALAEAYTAATGLRLLVREVSDAVLGSLRLQKPAGFVAAEVVPLKPRAGVSVAAPPIDVTRSAEQHESAAQRLLSEIERVQAALVEGEAEKQRLSERVKAAGDTAGMGRLRATAVAAAGLKAAKIAKLEQEVERYQQLMYVTRPRPKSESAEPLSQLAARLEKRLRDMTEEEKELKKQLRILPGLRRESARLSETMLWMESANLGKGLPYVSEHGPASGVNGPWPPPWSRSRNAGERPGAPELQAKAAAGSIGAVDAHAVGTNGLVGLDDLRREYKHGMQPEDLKVDPRTGLRVVDVPGSLREQFKDAVDCLLHFFSHVSLREVLGQQTVKAALLVSDQSVFVCEMNGAIKRCIDVVDFEDVILDAGGSGVGLRVAREHDVLLYTPSPQLRDDLVSCIVKLQVYNNGGLHRTVRIRQLAHGKRLEKAFDLRLSKPKGWVFRVTPLRTKKDLVVQINKLIAPGEEARKRRELERERWLEDVKRKWTAQAEANLARQLADPSSRGGQLREQLETEEKRCAALLREQLELKQQIVNHVCAGVAPEVPAVHLGGRFEQCRGAIIPPEGPGTFRGDASRYTWIPAQATCVNAGSPVSKVALCGSVLVSGHVNGSLVRWDVGTLSTVSTFTGHTGTVHDMVLIPAGDAALPLLVSCGGDSLVYVWSVATGQRTQTLAAHRGAVRCVSQCKDRLASGGDDSLIYLWGVGQDAACLRSLRGHKQAVVSLVLDEASLVSAEWGWVLLWSVDDGTVTRSLRDAYGGLRCLAASGRHVVTSGDGGDISVWDPALETSHTLRVESEEACDVVCMELYGRYCLVSTSDCRIRVWNLITLELVSFFHRSYPNEVRSFCFDEQAFVAAEDSYLRVWRK
eukprot:TRINITY_DN4202_c0_g1_i1.p1 TRINITY_DN4202_c0_g1~~TRINITY_DN4202_c0_g1_i1.p1  ORF type:complete len:1024 (+),score=268.07 TRINITY_DN4202_c0_g1_i1:64-3135(+)